MAKRILIVDDSFYMRTMLRNILSDAGYEIAGEAATGQQALQLARETKPDLVTLDVILPDNTGLDVLKGIRAEQPAQRIVMVSAVGQDVIVNEALASGAGAYLVKPFSEERVLEVVSQLLGADMTGDGSGAAGSASASSTVA
ncbi:MAG: response regulator [Hymenobacteraceae bacterium]|nr:response regulator [Hymenobacteraceae bacterium]